MSKNIESNNIEQLLAEAEDLIQKINSAAIKDMEEEHRLQFEKHAQNLKKIKAEVHGTDREERNIGNRLQRRGHARGDPRYCEGHAGLDKISYLISVKPGLNKNRPIVNFK